MKFIIRYVVLLNMLLISCTSPETQRIPAINASFSKKRELTDAEKQNWHFKDAFTDSIAGISLEKAYKELLQNKKGDTVIVALLDNRIDATHEDIKNCIWTNVDEIPDNGLDDDQNGFIDDIHGWNFLGNSKGKNVDLATFESTRIIRRYKNIFETDKEISNELNKEFELYAKAKKLYDSALTLTKERLKLLDTYDIDEKNLFKKLSKIYSEKELSAGEIENLSSSDSVTQSHIIRYRSHLKYADWRKRTRSIQNSFINIFLNTDYDERAIIGDNMYDLNDKDYGNGNINASRSSTHNHAIKVAGVLCANRENNKGIKGVSNTIKLMPVCVSPSGDEQDKDIALGIRYAVDNGAKIIIMTFTKSLVQNEDWLIEAFEYASKNDVFIVLSAGNASSNSDLNKTFPNDYTHEEEFVNTTIVVAGNTNSLTENLVANYSNYGKKSVDIFAPSEQIYTTKRDNTYGYESGTSLSAPIVAGIAALIRFYYPNLTAAEVKQIIMESGVSYDIMANKPSTNKEKELVPFSSLSKSGKIVNAYNALFMAEEVSKKKKRKKK